MTDIYSVIVSEAKEMAKQDVLAIVAQSSGYLPSEDRKNAFLLFKDNVHYKMLVDILYHLKKDLDAGLRKYEKAVSEAREMAKSDVRDVVSQSSGYLPSDECKEYFIKSYIKHLPRLIAISFPNKTKNVIENKEYSEISKEKFLVLRSNDPFYKKLLAEINNSYSKGLYTAALLLSRKLIENLLIDVLRKKYGERTKENKEKYFDIKYRKFHSFNILLRNLSDSKSDFEVDNEMIEEFLKVVSPFRIDANSKAHSLIHFIGNRNELKKYDVQMMADLLERLYEKI